MRHYIEKADRMIKEIVAKTFPDYHGKKFVLSTDVPKQLDSYWSGGSRNYFCFYSLTEKKTIPVESNHPFFEAGKPRFLNELPIGVLLVEHTIFCGRDLGITIYANSIDLAPLLDAPKVELTETEKVVLEYTAAYKSAYRLDAANRNYKISKKVWDSAKESLIAKGLLNKNGSINATGRNVRETFKGEIRHY